MKNTSMPSPPTPRTNWIEKSTQGQKARQTWMDLVRGTCIILVLLLHSFSLIKEKPGTEIIETFNQIFSPYRMPILMFLSGLLLHKAFNANGQRYVFGKVYAILWPFLIWSVIVLLAEDRLTLINMLKIPVSSPTLLWYLWFLFAYYLIALAVKAANIGFFAVAVVSLIASTFLPDFLRMSRFAYLLFFFLFGAIAFEKNLRVVNGWAIIALVGASITGSLISAAGARMNYEAIYAWAPISLAIALFSLPEKFYEFLDFRVLRWIGRNSIVFYVAHFPMQVVFFRYLSDLYSDSVFLLYLSIFITSLIGSMILAILRQHSWLFASLFDFRPIIAQLSKAHN